MSSQQSENVVELEPPRYCPVLGNRVWICRVGVFKKMCRKFRLIVEGKNAAISDYCKRCLDTGWLPETKSKAAIGNRIDFRVDELCVDLPQGRGGAKNIVEKEKKSKNLSATAPRREGKKQERTMATKKTGRCQLCLGEEKVLKKYDKIMVCASCQPVLIAAKNRPLSVQAALARFDNLPVAELKETSTPVPEEPEKPVEANSSVEIRLAKMEEYVERIERLGEMMSFLFARNDGCRCSMSSDVDHRQV